MSDSGTILYLESMKDFKMNSDYTIAHHWVPLDLFIRLGEMYPEGEYRGISHDTVVFKNKHTNVQENWFLNGAFCAEWYVTREVEINKDDEE
tara:strand:+ start:380 stop:655 length:276 start_codon:yes stop_codon:yes gene_type:complete